MRGELIRYRDKAHHCKAPKWWSRFVNYVALYDRWVCPDCGAVWEWGYDRDRGVSSNRKTMEPTVRGMTPDDVARYWPHVRKTYFFRMWALRNEVRRLGREIRRAIVTRW